MCVVGDVYDSHNLKYYIYVRKDYVGRKDVGGDKNLIRKSNQQTLVVSLSG